ncbi:MAG: hypothetical protein ACMUEM_07665 [Flavobacteriales bacterium AspAUS03]
MGAFNIGIGMLMAISPEDQFTVLEQVKTLGETVFVIGVVEIEEERIILK